MVPYGLHVSERQAHRAARPLPTPDLATIQHNLNQSKLHASAIEAFHPYIERPGGDVCER